MMLQLSLEMRNLTIYKLNPHSRIPPTVIEDRIAWEPNPSRGYDSCLVYGPVPVNGSHLVVFLDPDSIPAQKVKNVHINQRILTIQKPIYLSPISIGARNDSDSATVRLFFSTTITPDDKRAFGQPLLYDAGLDDALDTQLPAMPTLSKSTSRPGFTGHAFTLLGRKIPLRHADPGVLIIIDKGAQHFVKYPRTITDRAITSR
jgi:hypothetical protein